MSLARRKSEGGDIEMLRRFVVFLDDLNSIYVRKARAKVLVNYSSEKISLHPHLLSDSISIMF